MPGILEEGAVNQCTEADWVRERKRGGKEGRETIKVEIE